MVANALQTSMDRVNLWDRASPAGGDRRTDKRIGAAATILSRFPLPKRGGRSTGQSPGVGLQSINVKNRRSRAENLPYSHCNGRRPTPALRLGKVQRLAHPDEHRTIPQVEADRLRLIHQRLQADFYEVPPASEHIAAAVLADLTDLEEGASSLPH